MERKEIHFDSAQFRRDIAAEAMKYILTSERDCFVPAFEMRLVVLAL